MPTLGKYELHEELGRGGFAEVWKAEQAHPKRIVALKILRADLWEPGEAQMRFEREADAAGILFHPHTATVLEIGEANGRPYIAMQYIAGPSLDKVLAARGALPWEEALRILRQVASALDYAHGKGLIHRDVKPANILLGEEEGAVLTDFGLVRAINLASASAGTPSTGQVGTPYYKPPELWLGEKKAGPPAPATDVYSLSCVLAEMLRGEPLFTGDTPAEVMTAHVMAAYGLPDRWPQGVPRGLNDVLRKALAKAMKDRYPTAGAFLAAVQELIAAEERRKAEAARKRREACEAEEKARREAEERARREAEERLRKEIAHRQAPIENQQSEIVLTLASGVMMTLVRVPAGSFGMGSDKEKDPDSWNGELPQHEVYLEEYWIGKTPVTVAQFAAFVKATGYKTTAEERGAGSTYTGSKWEEVKGADWRHPRGPGSDVRGKGDHPVTLVSWHDAVAFCKWTGEVTAERIALPSEAEWEKAARGPIYNQKSEINNRIYPWGDQKPSKKLCNYDMNVGGTTPVGRYSPAGDSPYGCADMAGNVWEWTRSVKKDYPYNPADGREDLGDSGDCVLRGGSFGSSPRYVRCAYRYGSIPYNRSGSRGFRVVRSHIIDTPPEMQSGYGWVAEV